MEHGIRFAAVVMVAVAGSLAFSGSRLSGSVMFTGRTPWDALTVLVVVLPVYVGVAHAVPVWASAVVALVGLGCLVLGSTSQLFLSVGAVLLLVTMADAGLIGWCGTTCVGLTDLRDVSSGIRAVEFCESVGDRPVQRTDNWRAFVGAVRTSAAIG